MYKLLILLIVLLPITAYANVVWPALYLETRLFSWWAITVGLVIEYLFVRKLFSPPPVKAIISTFSANLCSAVIGIILIPLAGIAWEYFPGILMYKVLKMGTFNPVTWTATFIIACCINALLEGLVYKKAFKFDFKFKSWLFLWFVIANAFSVGVAIGSMFIKPVQL